MVEQDLGQATIVYEDPDDGTIERTVQNEHIAYFQDHWVLKTDEGEEGHDTIRRIPNQRVYYVERSVEEFEEEVKTVRDQVQSLADELRTKVQVLGGGGGRGGKRDEDGARHIDIETESGGPTESGSRSDDQP